MADAGEGREQAGLGVAMFSAAVAAVAFLHGCTVASDAREAAAESRAQAAEAVSAAAEANQLAQDANDLAGDANTVAGQALDVAREANALAAEGNALAEDGNTIADRSLEAEHRSWAVALEVLYPEPGILLVQNTSNTHAITGVDVRTYSTDIPMDEWGEDGVPVDRADAWQFGVLPACSALRLEVSSEFQYLRYYVAFTEPTGTRWSRDIWGLWPEDKAATWFDDAIREAQEPGGPLAENGPTLHPFNAVAPVVADTPMCR